MISRSLKLYYLLKPFLPEKMVLLLRRASIHMLMPFYRNVWPIDEQAGGAPPAWQGWPDEKKFAVVLTHDVEWKAGHDTCRQLSKAEESLGFRSAFYFVPHRYSVSSTLRDDLTSRGFEVGLHGLKHDGLLYSSAEVFTQRAKEINQYIREWKACGFRSPSVHCDLDRIGELDIQYDASTYDSDPFQPQGGGLRRIYPVWIPPNGQARGYVELPYTLAQDWNVFSILKQKNIDIWKLKLDWIAKRGGMALLITHPDYMQFGNREKRHWDYPAARYIELLEYIKGEYAGQYWQALPRDVASFWKNYSHKEEDYQIWMENRARGCGHFKRLRKN